MIELSITGSNDVITDDGILIPPVIVFTAYVSNAVIIDDGTFY
jgi:hypothetical protein